MHLLRTSSKSLFHIICILLLLTSLSGTLPLFAYGSSQNAPAAVNNAGVQIAPLNLAVVEGGLAAAYTIRLSGQPTDAVTITVATGGQTSVNPAAVTFSTQSWDTPQAVVVTAVDDGVVEGSHNDIIAHAAASADLDYNGIAINNLTVSIIDNDEPGVLINPATLELSEGGNPANYSIALKSQPMANVKIDISGTGQTTFLPASITFTQQNWTQPHAISVLAVDDAVIEGQHADTLSHTAASNDPDYANIPISDLSLAIIDNDTAGVLVTPTLLEVSEGGAAAAYTLALTSQPLANVSIDLAADAQQILAAPQTVTFTPQNWQAAKTVVVTAVDDLVVEAAQLSLIGHTASSADPLYAGLAISDVTVQLLDNDLVGLHLDQESLALSEGGESTAFTVSLLSQPTADVTINVFTNGQINVVPDELSFTPETWNTPQAVTVTAVDDDLYEGTHSGAVGQTTSSADERYDSLAVPLLPVTLIDNDSAELLVNPLSLNVSEGGTGDSYGLKLSSRPLEPVTVDVSSNAQISTSPASLTFTSLNWDIAQNVSVTAVDDLEIEGEHSATISHSLSSADAHFDGITAVSVDVTIIDNETASVFVNPTSLFVDEGGPPASYNVSLTGQPDQTVNITVDVTAQLTLTPALLTFNPDNWNIPQAVAVTAVDNDYVNEISTGVISHSVNSPDTRFDGITASDVDVTIFDDEEANVAITPATVTLEEGGASIPYAMHLTSKPTADVIMSAEPDAQTAVSPLELTFTPENWHIPQNLMLSALDDTLLEGDHTGTVMHLVSSTDPNYDNINIGNVIAAIVDNDVVSIQITPQTLPLTEGGAPATYGMRLSHQPDATVTIHIQTDPAQAALQGSNERVFSVDNWDIMQSVSVTAVNNALFDGPRASTIAHVATSSDTIYDGLTIADVLLEISDDEPTNTIFMPFMAFFSAAQAGGGGHIQKPTR